MSLIGRIRRGFTFVEIMLTVVILSSGLVFVLQSFVIALEALNRSDGVIAASNLLEEKTEEIKQKAIEDGGAEAGESAGEFDSGGRHYTWKADFKTSAADKTLKEAKVSISWPEGKKQREISVTTYVEGKK